LKALNDVEFGYQAPTASQYLEGERQLAMLAKPRAPDAPAPIRVASAAGSEPPAFPKVVPALSGMAIAQVAVASRRKPIPGPASDRPVRLDHVETRAE
jgi:hypothetical protein